jgi:hypothetical protein
LNYLYEKEKENISDKNINQKEAGKEVAFVLEKRGGEE